MTVVGGPEPELEPVLEPVLETARLRLRQWRDADLESFAAINADPCVMAYFPAPLDRTASDALAARWSSMFATRGFGMWAIEEKAGSGTAGAPFIGFVGLSAPLFEAAFTPCVETGWRLGRRWWGRGYASEAALAALAFGFDQLGLPEIVAYTAATNRRSRAVMERLGMARDPADDFDHPLLPAGHRLAAHVLYRLGRDAFDQGSSMARIMPA